ncbi:hypothetical protein RchiOBHm_Chr2g0104141 [Rosa chinensis]|uniref:Uncharacterized protein n=1 Tax=Rosa chinensis TaxID=74649 RepID=A0A2P6RN83_ROSCH|nr:hypothetical protein RchiOBHm_Chr2g0104141 [Rosa chinensis]
MDFIVFSINTKLQYLSSHQSKDFERGKVYQSSALCARRDGRFTREW